MRVPRVRVLSSESVAAPCTSRVLPPPLACAPDRQPTPTAELPARRSPGSPAGRVLRVAVVRYSAPHRRFPDLDSRTLRPMPQKRSSPRSKKKAKPPAGDDARTTPKGGEAALVPMEESVDAVAV